MKERVARTTAPARSSSLCGRSCGEATPVVCYLRHGMASTRETWACRRPSRMQQDGTRRVLPTRRISCASIPVPMFVVTGKQTGEYARHVHHAKVSAHAWRGLTTRLRGAHAGPGPSAVAKRKETEGSFLTQAVPLYMNSKNALNALCKQFEESFHTECDRRRSH